MVLARCRCRKHQHEHDHSQEHCRPRSHLATPFAARALLVNHAAQLEAAPASRDCSSKMVRLCSNMRETTGDCPLAVRLLPCSACQRRKRALEALAGTAPDGTSGVRLFGRRNAAAKPQVSAQTQGEPRHWRRRSEGRLATWIDVAQALVAQARTLDLDREADRPERWSFAFRALARSGGIVARRRQPGPGCQSRRDSPNCGPRPNTSS